jgi:hypothetical protein
MRRDPYTGDLFDRGDHPQERDRVYSRIASAILTFANDHAGEMFHVEQLRRYVRSRDLEVAPDSPGRILRELRLEGRINYVVINRRQSLYQFRPRS